MQPHQIFEHISADAKSAVLLRVPSLTKAEIRNFPSLHFPRWLCWFMDNLLCLCDMWKGLSSVNFNFSVSLIFNNDQIYFRYYFLRPRNSPIKYIQLYFFKYIQLYKYQLLRLYSQFSRKC